MGDWFMQGSPPDFAVQEDRWLKAVESCHQLFCSCSSAWDHLRNILQTRGYWPQGPPPYRSEPHTEHSRPPPPKKRRPWCGGDGGGDAGAGPSGVAGTAAGGAGGDGAVGPVEEDDPTVADLIAAMEEDER
ncbi:hypothetical protein TTdoV_gp1 [Torque teno douroucouli virus]|uniref:Uncharacterized ORF2 protein n=1 Tax=Torque teno douroucouli virus (isolate At-TTV3) TaxID=766187 RepID=ORF2_TTVZ1|nr:hypothetical protein TTdoV_gp1 [Torque teno douroucouli virus]Q9DUB8.1 RecName: Full=Uncharacterized ORF2 protein [Torque teno douroucouli virus (isolate At-TTV3)]BAB19319.1 unnamed protein product [Torque teno douroucouli virus]